MRLSKIQQDPVLTAITSLPGIKPKQLIGTKYHDCSGYDQCAEHITQEHDIQTEQSDLIANQIRMHTLLSRQLKEEERGQF